MVDDSEITPAGQCKVDAWGARANTHDWQAVVSPACTLEALPEVELSVFGSRTRSEGAFSTTIGPKAKVTLLPIETYNIGIGLSAGLGYSTTIDRLESVSMVVPFTIQPLEVLRLNFNIGWLRERDEEMRDFLTFGAGFEFQIVERLMLIGEVFGRDRGRGGGQIGLRPTLIEDTLDLDLVYGHNIDGTHSNWLTLGATYRF